jgi:hypothetical protein
MKKFGSILRALKPLVILVFWSCILSVLMVVTCYIPHDLLLTKQILKSIFGLVTLITFTGVALFIAGGGVAIFMVTCFTGPRTMVSSWLSEVRWYFSRSEIRLLSKSFLAMLGVCPAISWVLDKIGLRLIPTGSVYWSWCTFGNILLSEVIFWIACLGVFGLVDLLEETRRRNRMVRQPNGITY